MPPNKKKKKIPHHRSPNSMKMRVITSIFVAVMLQIVSSRVHNFKGIPFDDSLEVSLINGAAMNKSLALLQPGDTLLIPV